MNRTKISWTNYTWNPITGCTPISEGCKNCYAKTVHERFNDTPFNEIVLHPNRLIEPIKTRKPTLVFLGSMTDIFHDDIPTEWIDEIFHSMMRSYHVTFQILTKRPQRMKEYIEGLLKEGIGRISSTAMQSPLTSSEVGFVRRWDKSLNWCARDFDEDTTRFLFGKNSVDIKHPFHNIWFGVTVENQIQADIRIPILLDTKVTNRFLSIEPLIDEVNINKYLNEKQFLNESIYENKVLKIKQSLFNKIDWVIVGGETGAKSKTRNMKTEWIEKIYEDCNKNSTNFFFKQWGNSKPLIRKRFWFEDAKQFPKCMSDIINFS